MVLIECRRSILIMKSLMPKVSVIVPNYNCGKFLKRRMDTILSQTFKDYEIIFLDDFSKDNSFEVIENYRSKIAKFVVNERNSGSPFKQWKKGVELASGKYIWIAESDDFSDENFLQRTVKVLDECSNVGLVYTQSIIADENDRHDNVTYKEYVADLDPIRWKSDYTESGRVECSKYLCVRNVIPNVSAVLFRKKVFDAKEVIYTNSRLCGDWLTYCNILKDWDIYFISDALNYHRSHGGTARETTFRSGEYVLELLKTINYLSTSFEIDDTRRKHALNNFLSEWYRSSKFVKNPFLINLKVISKILLDTTSVNRRYLIGQIRKFLFSSLKMKLGFVKNPF